MSTDVDLFVIGGGINGAAVARDAVGRGLSARLAEMGDYAHATSSASSKMIHGGLRYLEYYEFRLVRESLREREVMLKIAPHLVSPMRFLFPITGDAPRPAFIVRIGLWLYDILSGRQMLEPTGRLSAEQVRALPRLKTADIKAILHYPDCWADDSRLTLETLLDARERGADIGNYREVTAVRRDGDGYRVAYRDAGDDIGGARECHARFVVNAGGPWVNRVLDRYGDAPSRRKIKLVRGSHIVLAMPDPPQRDAYTLQNDDRRVVFVLPWMERYLLIGTTDIVHNGDPGDVHCSAAERDYLLAAYRRYFDHPVGVDDVIWTYAGVRPLVDDGADNPSKLTRDYVLEIEPAGAGGSITVYGGKITTHRRLAEKVLDALAGLGAKPGPAWTATAPLYGGHLDHAALERLAREDAPVPAEVRRRWTRTYGSRTRTLYDALRQDPEAATMIAPGIPRAELDYAVAVEDARGPEDFLYRRTKLFLALEPEERAAIERWFAARPS